MAHEFETGMFVGQAAWHGLGVVLAQPPTVAEAINLSGLNWGVNLRPLFLQTPTVDPLTAEVSVALQEVTHRATVRDSDGSVLGIVGPDYVPLQNSAAFEWFQPFIASGAATLEAAGSLKGGKKVWVLAKIAGGIADIVPGDPVEQFVLLAHAHDGSLAIRVGFTAIRVVCNNTLTAAVNDKSKATRLLRVKHTKSAGVALEEIRGIMDLAKREFAATAEQLRFLASVGCNEATLTRYVREVFEAGSADKEDGSKRLLPQIIPLFEAGVGAQFSRGTFWGAFNSVTEFITHHQGRTQDGRVESGWFGEGAKVTARALSVALEMAGA